MGLSACQPVDARRRHGADRCDDPRQPRRPDAGFGACARLIAALAAALLWALPAAADSLRIATWNVELDRAGPGLLVRDIARGEDPQVLAVLAGIVALDADVLLLTGVDFDTGLVALNLLADRLTLLGAEYPYRLALAPNTGVPTGLDLNGDGRLGTPDDAQGWGRFAGQGGMALLSRLPLGPGVRDFSGFLWADLPGALLPEMAAEVRSVQRLSTTGHWSVPLLLPDGGTLTLLAWHATPPVFDGPEDRNGRRNHDETAFWLHLLDGRLPEPPPEGAFVVIGDSNLDPVDGDGRPEAIRALLAHPALQDPAPRGSPGRAEPGHQGDPAQDTAIFAQTGGLRVDLVLPSADLTVTASGVLWPPDADPLAATLTAASRHRPVWVEVEVP